MDTTNAKIITVSFVIAGVLTGFVLGLMLQTFSGTFGFVARYTDSDLVTHGVPALIGILTFAYFQFSKAWVGWADEVVSEIKKIVWPSRKDTTAMTIVVCIMVLISSLIIATFDFLSGFVINTLIR